jgi:hypothetical protein
MNILHAAADAPAGGYLCARNTSYSTAKKPCRNCDFEFPRDVFKFVPFLLVYLAQHCQQLWGSLPTNPPFKILTQEEDEMQRVHLPILGKTAAAKYSSETGLRFVSGGLSWCKGIRLHRAVPFDGMLVWLEGILKFQLYLLFHWLVKSLGLPLGQLNDMLGHFDDLS